LRGVPIDQRAYDRARPDIALTVPEQDPEDYAMHEVAAQAPTKKLNPESLAMRADEAGSVGSPDGVPDRRWIALYVLCAGVLMDVLDATIVNVALPSIKHDLGFSQSDLAWVLNAYLIAFGGLLLLAGRVGDLIGQRRVFLAGLAVFTTASALCAVAQSQGLLIAARFVQGVGGALTAAVILGMIVTMFPQPREQAKAIGVYGFVASAGGSIGLLAGGVLTQLINWHWIFVINVPVGVVTALLAVRLIDDLPGIGLRRGADLPGALLLIGGLMLGVYTILQAGGSGSGLTQTPALGGLSIALLVAFVVRQNRIPNPLMPLRLFRSREVSGANAVQALLVVGMFAMFFLGALYLQQVLHYDALHVGLAYLPGTVMMAIAALRLSEPLASRFGPLAALLPGLTSIGVALLLFARTPVDAVYAVDVLPAMVLLGLGAGLAFPAITTVAMSGATASDSGLASGLVNSSLNVGGAIGLAALATVATHHTNGLIASGQAHNVALNAGYHVAYLVAVVAVAAAIGLALTFLRPTSSRSDERQEPLELNAPAPCSEAA
jgi:EmrB/QacA subfamily drug resistance transporter